MKKNVLIAALLLLCCMALGSCKDDDKELLTVELPTVLQLYSGNDTVFDITSSTLQVSVESSNPYSVNAGVSSYSTIGISQGNSTRWYLHGAIRGKYVGKSNVSFSISSGLKQSIQVIVQPRYTTYEEPNIDFDDKRDSVVQKLGRPHVVNSTDSTSTYVYYGYSTAMLLMVDFDSNEVVRDYMVNMGESVDSVELRLFVKERYASYMMGFYMDADMYIDATKLVFIVPNMVFYFPASTSNKNALDGCKRQMKAILDGVL